MAGASGTSLPPLVEREEEDDQLKTQDLMQPPLTEYAELSHSSDPISAYFLHPQPSDLSLRSLIVIDSDEDEEQGEAIAADVKVHEIERSDSISELHRSDRDESIGISFDLFNRRNHLTDVDRIKGSDSRVFEEIVDVGTKCSEWDERVSLSLNLFNRCNRQNCVDPIGHSDNRVFEEDPQNGLDGLELGLGFGIGNQSAMTGNASGDGFFLGNSAFVTGESSQARTLESDSLGLPVAFESGPGSTDGCIGLIDLNSDGEDTSDGATEHPSLHSLCWNCLQVEDPLDSVEDLEWEDVNRRPEEREAINMEIEMAINGAFDATVNEEDLIQEMDDVSEVEEDEQIFEWEFRVSLNNQADQEMESIVVEQGNYIYPTGYEVYVLQLPEAENSLTSYRPAAISVIENLPSVFLTEEDVENNNAVCPICKDDISPEEQVKRLPCRHHYHADCILPWLRIQNTCPVCRFELLTDDLHYEHLRSLRAAHGADAWVSYVRYDFETLPLPEAQ